MDRPLEDVIAERQRRGNRGGRGGGGRRPDTFSRNDSRKWNNTRSDAQDIETDWVHDKYEDDPHTRQPFVSRNSTRTDRYTPEPEITTPVAKLRVDNLHYDLTEDDLDDLFTRIAPVISLSLRFDRAGRSTGTAYVSYASISAANRAIREFDGANAAGQPIRLTLLPTAPSYDLIRGRGAATARNPFETAVKPSRSLFDRIEEPNGGRDRSRSPGAPRRTNTSKPPPEGVDRYVPGQSRRSRRSRTRSPRGRSPISRRRSPVERRAGGRRDDKDTARAGRGGPRMVGGRPRKTQEELDREMEDYWGKKGDQNGTAGEKKGDSTAVATAAVDEMDIEMIT